MPYLVAVYDVTTARCTKVLKVFRRYLHHVQQSVFEGSLTDRQYRDLRDELTATVDPATDSVIFYAWADERFVQRSALGPDADKTSERML